MTGLTVTVARRALERLLDVLELSEDVLVDDEDLAAYEDLCAAAGCRCDECRGAPESPA